MQIISLKSLQNNKIFEKSKSKAVIDNKTYQIKKLKFEMEPIETLWEKEKIQITRIFSFSHNVFKRLLSKGVKAQGCLVKG